MPGLKHGRRFLEQVPLEKVGLPGEWEKVVFVSSDATTSMVAAIDWKHGLVFRERIADLEPWIRRALEEEDHDSEELVVHLAEMLSFVAFACAVGHRWRGAVVVYGGDNQVVKHWLQSRKAGIRAGRILVRVVNMVEIRYGCVILAGWWRTYHSQGWPSPYLNHKEDSLENENKILGFMGYLGWLGSSSATLKQALFAIKDAHKKGGAGDPIPAVCTGCGSSRMRWIGKQSDARGGWESHHGCWFGLERR